MKGLGGRTAGAVWVNDGVGAMVIIGAKVFVSAGTVIEVWTIVSDGMLCLVDTQDEKMKATSNTAMPVPILIVAYFHISAKHLAVSATLLVGGRGQA